MAPIRLYPIGNVIAGLMLALILGSTSLRSVEAFAFNDESASVEPIDFQLVDRLHTKDGLWNT
jgi:hypothetical protein